VELNLQARKQAEIDQLVCAGISKDAVLTHSACCILMPDRTVLREVDANLMCSHLSSRRTSAGCRRSEMSSAYSWRAS
jgi:hypothetical protein